MLFYNPKNSRNHDLINTYLDVTLTHSLDEFKKYEGDKFFLLTIMDIYFANETKTDVKSYVNWETVFSKELIKELMDGKYPIFVENTREYSAKFEFDIVDEFCDYIKANYKDVYLCFANTQAVSLNLLAYPNLKKYNLLSIECFEFDAVQFGYSLGTVIYKFKFNDRKRFLFLNRRYSMERAYFYFKFHEFNLLDNMHCTFRLDNIDEFVSLETAINELSSCGHDDTTNYINSNIDYFKKSLPHTLNTKLYEEDYRTDCIYTLWNIAAHNSTDINIITETFRYNYILSVENQLRVGNTETTVDHLKAFHFITEKTYRTILMKQPFILFSNAYALQSLRNSGYKTFSPIIDETYDTIENLIDRQKAIITEIKRLGNMQESEFNEVLHNCREIAEHNYNNLMNRIDDKYHNTIWPDEKIKPYLKEIDKKVKPGQLINWHKHSSKAIVKLKDK